ncbi:hypothetical protein FOA52_005371 [Chlamydomonas sp. UWO 241]|nr:hypothetical protein FOA52_005371 [Chlamydomonas sp. UWO 241]
MGRKPMQAPHTVGSSNSSSSSSSGGGGGANESSVAGCALLVAGTTVGAGVLALPAVTAPAGFGATAVALSAGSCYSIVTGLLLAEVTINMISSRNADAAESSSSSEQPPTSLTSIAVALIGGGGAVAVAVPYLFLHYSMLVAYIAKAGDVLGDWTGLPVAPAALLFTCGLGGAVYVLPDGGVDRLNGALVAMVGASFLGLLAVAGSDIDPARLGTAHWGAVVPALPIIALSFVYQNVVPVVVQRLGRDPAKVTSAIVLGMAGPLIMFLLWDGAVIGSAPSGSYIDDASALAAAGGDPLQALRDNDPVAGLLIEVFAMGAVATSFLGFVLSITEYLGDMAATAGGSATCATPEATADATTGATGATTGTTTGAAGGAGAAAATTATVATVATVATPGATGATGATSFAAGTTPEGRVAAEAEAQQGARQRNGHEARPPIAAPLVVPRFALYAAVLLPPLCIALVNPGAFLGALEYAGTYGVLSLFGVLPPVLAWLQRYGSSDGVPPAAGRVEMVPGGRPMLVAVGACGAAVIANQAHIHLTQLAV